MCRTASSTSSVTQIRSRSLGPILPSRCIVARIQSSRPPQYAVPISTTGNRVTFRVCTRVSASNSSSMVPNPPGSTTNACGVLDEHRLADEEVPEVDADVDPVVEALLERQLDAEPDGQPAGLGGALVRRLHHARAAAGDHRVPGPGQRRAEPFGQRRTRGCPACCGPSRRRSPPAAGRRACRSPRRTRRGCAAPARRPWSSTRRGCGESSSRSSAVLGGIASRRSVTGPRWRSGLRLALVITRHVSRSRPCGSPMTQRLRDTITSP